MFPYCDTVSEGRSSASIKSSLYFQELELGIAEGILLRCREKAGP